MALDRLVSMLGSDAENLLNHECKTISKAMLHIPGNDFV